MNNLKCKECGKVCRNQRGFNIHVAMHTRHAAKQARYAYGHRKPAPAVSNGAELSALDRVLEALSLISAGSPKLLSELRDQRAGLMATVDEIDKRIGQIEAIQSSNPRVIAEIPIPE